MEKLPPTIHALTLAAAIAFVGAVPVSAAPVPAMPVAVHSDVVPVVDSKVVRRYEPDRDGLGWKKRRFQRDGFRAERRHRKYEHRDDVRNEDHDGGAHRPRATTKFAYDAYGNLRVYPGRRWGRNWDDRGWDDGHSDYRYWDGGDDGRRGDWNEKPRRDHGPRIIKLNRSTVPHPPLVLQDILTATPD